MTEKTKKLLIIGLCCLLCVAAVVGIASRYSGNAVIPSGTVEDAPADNSAPTVKPDPNPQPVIEILPGSADTDPAAGADSEGTNQSIQADPVKPDVPQKPDAPSGEPALPENHKSEDVPKEDRRTEDENPPAYVEQPTAPPKETESAAGSTNSNGQVYVPGFGYVENSGENTVISGDDIYENGNKIGIMGGN